MKSEYRLGTLAWAAAFIFFGVALLLFNLNVLIQYEAVVRLVLASLLGAGAAGFFLGYFAARRAWSRLMPAWTLLALALMVVVSGLQTVDQRLTAAILFIGQAAAFVNIYLLRRNEHWWAVIPGGFMLVLGLVIALSSRIARPETLGALLFVGMGLVFFAVYWLAKPGREWWALVPGVALSVFGLLIFTVGVDTSGENGAGALVQWWPLLLILIGVAIGLRGARRAPGERLRVDSAPKTPPKKKPGTTTPHPPEQHPDEPTRAALGDYSQPAPGATVEILPDPEE